MHGLDFEGREGALPGILANDILTSETAYFDAGLVNVEALGARTIEMAPELSATNRAAGHRVHNFEVEGTHTYIAGGVRVHNCSSSLECAIDLGLTGISVDGETVTGLSPDGNGIVRLKKIDGVPGEFKYRIETEFVNADGVRLLEDRTYDEAGGFRDELIGAVSPYSQFGENAASALVPHLAALLPATDNLLVDLLQTTALTTGLTNLGEAVGLLASGATQGFFGGTHSATDLALSAFNDIGVDLTLAGISAVSSLITSEIFGNFDLHPVLQAGLETVANAGVNTALQQAAFALSEELSLGLTATAFDFASLGVNIVPALFSAILGAAITTEEGQLVYSALTTAASIAFIGIAAAEAASVAAGTAVTLAAIESGALAASSTALAIETAAAGAQISGAFTGALAASAPYTAGIAFIAFVAATVIEGILDEDPEARVITQYDPNSRKFEYEMGFTVDGGDIEVAYAIGNSYVEIINEVMSTIHAQVTSDHHRTIGYIEHATVTELDHWTLDVSGHSPGQEGGQEYENRIGLDQGETIIYAVLSEIANLQLQNGDPFARHVLDQQRQQFDDRLNKQFAWQLLEEIILRTKNQMESGDNGEATSLKQAFEHLIAGRGPETDAAEELLARLEIAPGSIFSFNTSGDNDQLSATLIGSYEEFATDAASRGASLSTVLSDLTTALQIADDYRTMLANGEVIQALIEDNPNSAFAAGWALTLLQATEMGLTELAVDADDLLYGNALDNTIYGLAGTDTVDGGYGDDALFGGAGVDWLFGQAGDDFLHGGDGTDTLIGSNGEDTLIAGDGDGTWQGLYGGRDGDTYVYAKASGRVNAGNASTETDGKDGAEYAGTDVLVFEDLALADVDFSLVDADTHGTDLRITWAEDGQSGDIRTGRSGSVIERFEFADGSVLSGVEFNGTLAYLRGTSQDDTIVGGEASEYLYGNAGNDVLDAGGSDGSVQKLFGYDGGDTYIYRSNSGTVHIATAGTEQAHGTGEDRVVFQDLALRDLVFSMDGTSLRVDWALGDQSGHVIVGNGGDYIERFEFADGSVLRDISVDPELVHLHAPSGLEGATIVGGTTTDRIWGSDGNDYLDAGNTGSLTQGLYGGDGSDTYVYRKASRNVNIGNASTEDEYGDNDVLIFEDLAFADVSFSFVDGGGSGEGHGSDLLIQWNDGNQSGEVRVGKEGHVIDRYEFADGTKLSNIDLDPGLVHVSAARYDPAATIVGGSTTDRIWGREGDDYLDAGGTSGGLQGLYGRAGSDTYVYRKASGAVNVGNANTEVDPTTMVEYAGTDTLRLEDLTVGEIDFAIALTDLRLRWNDGNGNVDIHIGLHGEAIERYEFAGERGFDAIWHLDHHGDEHGSPEVDARVLYANDDADLVIGSDGENHIYSFGGDDWLIGGAGKDRLVAGDGDDWLDVGAGSTVDGQEALGGAGNDTYVVSSASGYVNIRSEEAGADFDEVRFTDLALSDFHRIRLYDPATNRVSLDYANGGSIHLWQADAFERLVFGDGQVFDSIDVAASSGEYLYGRSGDYNDLLIGREGHDRLYGGDGDDFLFAGGGNAENWNYLEGGNGDDTYHMSVGSGRVWISGNAETADSGTADRVIFEDLLFSDFTFGTYDYGSDHYNGNSLRMYYTDANGDQSQFGVAQMGAYIETYEFADGTELNGIQVADVAGGSLSGTAGADYLLGKEGDDTIEGGAGADMLDGGDGFDFLSYEGSSSRVAISLQTGHANFADATGDEFTNFEAVIGSAYDDLLTGSFRAEQMFGGAGDDLMQGAGGDDVVGGGDGADTLFGGEGSDVLLGDAGNDVLYGENGMDAVLGGAGDDDLFGGAGPDYFFFENFEGHDTIHDLELGVDFIYFTGGHLAAGDLVFANTDVDGNGLMDTLVTAQGSATGSITVLDHDAASVSAQALFIYA